MRRRTAFERANGGDNSMPPTELREFRVWCQARGYKGWEHHSSTDLAGGSVFGDWCEQRRQWAQAHGGWPGDPDDTGEVDTTGTSLTGAVRFAEELDEIRSGAIPDMPWTEIAKYP